MVSEYIHKDSIPLNAYFCHVLHSVMFSILSCSPHETKNYHTLLKIKQVHQKKRQRIKANANLQTTNDFQGGSPSHFNGGRLHELIVGPAWNPIFKEAQTANKSLTHIFDDSSKSQLIVKSKSEGARAAPNLSSQLIVASINSKISFHFCENCRIFREGVKGATAIPNGLFGRNLAFGLISAFGYITVGCCIALQLHHSPNCLAVADGLIVKINDLQQTEMFYSTTEFQLVVDSIVILNCEGALAVPITISEGANAVPVIFRNRSSKFIVASNSEGEISKAESECFGINGQISLTELIVTMF